MIMKNQLRLTYGMKFKRVAHPCDDEGGEFHVCHVSPNLCITVLHRLTGFGYMEWETGFGFGREDFILIRDDRRENVKFLTEAEAISYARICSNQKNSADTILDVLIEITQQ